jgi:hypothetical protein
MEYNTTREKLVIPEYGRNVQKLIEYARTIEDKDERTEFAHIIVRIMSNINPESRETGGDLRHKLWDHLHIISEFSLDVNSPYEMPDVDQLHQRPEPLEYKSGKIQFKHYGKNLKAMVQFAIDKEEGDEKEALIRALANHMKKSYLNWNRDSVNDELIYQHMDVLSEGNIKIDESIQLNHTNEILARQRKRKTISPRDDRGGDSRSDYRGSNDHRGGDRYSRPRTQRPRNY